MSKEKVLILTHSDSPDVTKVTDELNRLDEPYIRLDVDSWLSDQMQIELGVDQQSKRLILGSQKGKVNVQNVKSVYHRRPKKPIISREYDEDTRQYIEDEITASLWSLYSTANNCLWVNNPLIANKLVEHNKFYQLEIAKKVGLSIPPTMVTNNADKLLAFAESQKGEIALKTVKSRLFNFEKGTYGIYTNKVTASYIRKNKKKVTAAPVTAQAYISKKLELRITVIGSNVHACAIHSQDKKRTQIDWRHYGKYRVRYEKFHLPQTVEEKILSFMSEIGLEYGAIDMIITPEDEYFFLEINPNGQYRWIEAITDIPISRSIAHILANT